MKQKWNKSETKVKQKSSKKHHVFAIKCHIDTIIWSAIYKTIEYIDGTKYGNNETP